MATAAYTSTKATPRAVPDDAVVYREYAHQVMSAGEWGAFSRTARVCKVSHQHVRNVVARHGPKPSRTDAISRELAYEPAPGEKELATERETVATEVLLRQLLEEQPATVVEELTSTPSSPAIPSVVEVATVEREFVLPAYDPFANRRQVTRSPQTGVYVVAVIVVGMTVLALLTAMVAPLLSLLLLPEVLGMWWGLGQLRRLV